MSRQMTTVVERALTTEKLFPLLRVKYSEVKAASAARLFQTVLFHPFAARRLNLRLAISRIKAPANAIIGAYAKLAFRSRFFVQALVGAVTAAVVVILLAAAAIMAVALAEAMGAVWAR